MRVLDRCSLLFEISKTRKENSDLEKTGTEIFAAERSDPRYGRSTLVIYFERVEAVQLCEMRGATVTTRGVVIVNIFRSPTPGSAQ